MDDAQNPRWFSISDLYQRAILDNANHNSNDNDQSLVESMILSFNNVVVSQGHRPITKLIDEKMHVNEQGLYCFVVAINEQINVVKDTILNIDQHELTKKLVNDLSLFKDKMNTLVLLSWRFSQGVEKNSLDAFGYFLGEATDFIDTFELWISTNFGDEYTDVGSASTRVH